MDLLGHRESKILPDPPGREDVSAVRQKLMVARASLLTEVLATARPVVFRAGFAVPPRNRVSRSLLLRREFAVSPLLVHRSGQPVHHFPPHLLAAIPPDPCFPVRIVDSMPPIRRPFLREGSTHGARTGLTSFWYHGPTGDSSNGGRIFATRSCWRG